jgi:hypothetical protein
VSADAPEEAAAALGDILVDLLPDTLETQLSLTYHDRHTGRHTVKARLGPKETAILIGRLTACLGTIAQCSIDELKKWVETG